MSYGDAKDADALANQRRAEARRSIFVVITDDRHVDPAPEVFTERDAAVEYAQSQAIALNHHPEYLDLLADPPEGWLYLATYSSEGDCVWVVEKELR
jgi:hypothetical protein